MKQKSELFKKVIMVLIIIILFNFSFIYKSNAVAAVAAPIISGGRSLLIKPICSAIVAFTDMVNIVGSVVFVDKAPDDTNNSWTTAWDEFVSGDLTGGIYEVLMSPDKIFSGEVSLLNANIFEAESTKDSIISDVKKEIEGGAGGSLAPTLKRTVAGIYAVLRNIAALILLCLLIYTGIRILLTSASPYKQAEWKKQLLDWVKALFLLVFIHIIMIGIFYISDALVNTLKSGFGGHGIVAMIRKCFEQTSIWDGMGAIAVTVLYLYATYLTFVFFISYFKRLVWIVMLIVISPIVSVTCALGKSQIFNKWFKEFITAVLIQPFDMLIFYVLVGLPLGAVGGSTDGGGVLATLWDNVNPLNQSSLIIYIYMLLSISMIRPAEKFFMGLADMKGQVAQQASTESGEKTMKKVEKAAMTGVKIVADVTEMATTGGTSAGFKALDMANKVTQGIGKTTETAEGATDALGMADELSTGNSMLDNEIARNDGEIANLRENADWLIDNDMMTDEMMERFAAKEEQLTSKGDLLSSIKNDMNNGNEGAGVDKLDKAADKLSNAADKLGDAADNFDVSDAEFDETMGDQTPRPKNKLMEKLESNPLYNRARTTVESNPLYNYAKTNEGKENLNELRGAANELRDSMYLDGAPQEWKDGAFGYDKMKEQINQNKKDNLNAFVNNKNNISYMKQAHDLSTDDAKKRLEEAAPYINRGITDIGAIDKMISEGRQGKSPNEAIRTVAKEAKTQATINRTVNDQSKVNSIAQIIASSTGSRVDSPRVQQQAKQTMEAARPYIAKGEKDPEVLHRLVQLENNLKNAKIGANVRTPDKVMRMDKKIDKAMKDGLNKVEMKTNQSTSQGMKQVESVMNKELRNRKALGSNN